MTDANSPEDPIVDEVRAVRQEHAARFGYDLTAIFEDIRAREQTSSRRIVKYPPRRLQEPDVVVEGTAD